MIPGHKPEDHHIEVVYYNTDDGIYLVCSCDWKLNASFFPTPEKLVELANEHRKEEKGRK